MFKNTIAVGPREPAEFCVTGGATVAIALLWKPFCKLVFDVRTAGRKAREASCAVWVVLIFGQYLLPVHVEQYPRDLSDSTEQKAKAEVSDHELQLARRSSCCHTLSCSQSIILKSQPPLYSREQAF
jgi:hypothetical protein